MSVNNTRERIAVAVVTIPFILFICYLGGLYFLIFALLIGLFSFYEFTKMAKRKGGNTLLYPGLIVIALVIFNSFIQIIDFFHLIILSVIVLSVIELYRDNGSAISNLSTTFLGIFYIGLFASSLVGIREFFNDDLKGGYLIISILVIIWICDSAAFFGGVKFGKHRLFLRVSPKKSWEGAIFGFVFAILTAIAAKYILLGFLSWVDVIFIGVVIGTVGQIGDLIESLFKRDSGIKDSSDLIPGHGGIFDRFDSLLASSPIVFVYLNYFVLR